MLYANLIYFLGTEQNPSEIFVYGISLPTSQTEEFSLNPEKIKKITSDKWLFCFKSVKNIGDFLSDGTIVLTQFYAKPICANLPIICNKSFIQSHELCAIDELLESPINSLTKITSYYTKEVLEHKFDKSDFVKLLKTLEEDTNQKFYGNYVKRLGCFEIANVMPWAETIIPFSINHSKDTGRYIFHKEPDFEQDLSVILKIYHTYNEKIFEQLVLIPKDKNDIEFNFSLGHKSH